MATEATSYGRVQRFIAERCVCEPDLFVTGWQLYDCYSAWSMACEKLPMDTELFEAALANAFEMYLGVRPCSVETDNGKETRGYLGVGLSAAPVAALEPQNV